jgi:hypothetical protein
VQVFGEGAVFEGVVGGFEGGVGGGVEVVKERGEFHAHFERVSHGGDGVKVRSVVWSRFRFLGMLSCGVCRANERLSVPPFIACDAERLKLKLQLLVKAKQRVRVVNCTTACAYR